MADMCGYERAIIPIDKARNIIPAHVNCRCGWVTPPVKIEKVRRKRTEIKTEKLSEEAKQIKNMAFFKALQKKFKYIYFDPEDFPTY